jgi:hypothetical protein
MPLGEKEKDMKKKQGLLYLLERSAALLERIAEEIWISHTIAGRWRRACGRRTSTTSRTLSAGQQRCSMR